MQCGGVWHGGVKAVWHEGMLWHDIVWREGLWHEGCMTFLLGINTDYLKYLLKTTKIKIKMKDRVLTFAFESIRI